MLAGTGENTQLGNVQIGSTGEPNGQEDTGCSDCCKGLVKAFRCAFDNMKASFRNTFSFLTNENPPRGSTTSTYSNANLRKAAEEKLSGLNEKHEHIKRHEVEVNKDCEALESCSKLREILRERLSKRYGSADSIDKQISKEVLFRAIEKVLSESNCEINEGHPDYKKSLRKKYPEVFAELERDPAMSRKMDALTQLRGIEEDIKNNSTQLAMMKTDLNEIVNKKRQLEVSIRETKNELESYKTE